jgi:hypothetical protein
MRRYSTGIYVFALAAVLAIACVSPTIAVVPKPDGYTTVKLAQGWYADQLVWYIGTATSDPRLAQTGGLTLASKLRSAIDAGAPDIYIVLNFQQGPVFSIVPTGLSNDYSGLWRVHYVTWTTGVRRPITNSDPYDAVTNPYGVPTTGATVVETDIIVDYPILIVGGLGRAQPTYKIGQLVSFNATAKTAVLPYFNAFFPDMISKKVYTIPCLITDSSNVYIAPMIKANFAHGLYDVDDSNTMAAWIFDFLAQVQPPGQLPILDQRPTALSWRNANRAYSPVARGHLLLRATASRSAIINNPTTIGVLIGTGAITQEPDASSLNIAPLSLPL